MKTMKFSSKKASAMLLATGFSFGLIAQNAQQAAAPVAKEESIFMNPTFLILFITAIVLMGVIMSLTSALKNLSESGRQKLQNEKSSTPISVILAIAGLFSTFAANAQDAAVVAAPTGPVTDKMMPPMQIGGLDSWVFVIVGVVIIIEFIVILGLLRSIKNLLIGLGYQPELAEKEVKPLINWKWLDRTLNDSVPMDKEAEILTDHEYDGIRELDNNLPPWWKYGFYLTIIFAVYYLFDYHVLRTSPLSGQEYQQQMAEAEAMKKERLKDAGANVDENTVTLLADAGMIAAGKGIYDGNCASCHGVAGEGLVGPNLTDEFWLHGGGIKNIFKTIKYGVPAKGMIAWQSQLNPEAMQKVSSYIMTLQGTKPANAKAPQGEVWTEVAAAPADTNATASSAVDTTKVK
jgi:cytochrome c oxidase cbb3-type subunit 3